MSVLALLGGKPVRSEPFPEYRTIGEEEKQAVLRVLESGVLSGFLGTWSPGFYGGPMVRQLERAWEQAFGVKHAVSVNSATSGLYAAVGAAGIGPGDEVIVSPYTMIASASAALIYSGIPVFADIDPETFCISPETIRARLTPRTRAIIVVDIFGHPADMEGIMALAEERGLIVIEDAAQAPGATLNGRLAGTLGHMGVFSLNYHKTIHCGEGGVVVTNDPRLAERLQLIRNHGEVVAGSKGVTDLINLVGFNYRMTEIEAAIASEQLKKLDQLVAGRRAVVARLLERLSGLPGITLPVVRPGVEHGWYLLTMRFDAARAGISRRRFVEAVQAEGVPLVEGYVKPIYLEPLYQQRIAFGSQGFPFTLAGGATERPDYAPGLCPVAERMHFQEVIFTNACHAGIGAREIEDLALAFRKVLEHASELTRDPGSV
ncbi:MAG: DegT/DnrJ/EryC1/StrS family aminotransferase [Magnetococcales bacterium]|nr:DegT/DnrJ/EryC1/StrS family aminotransferase [Magnetococcales bacterium]